MPPPPPPPPDESAYRPCVVCLELSANHGFKHNATGFIHTCVCGNCAIKHFSAPDSICPVCREPIDKIVFTGAELADPEPPYVPPVVPQPEMDEEEEQQLAVISERCVRVDRIPLMDIYR